eukprot:445044-Amphidinium_carterae.1
MAAGCTSMVNSWLITEGGTEWRKEAAQLSYALEYMRSGAEEAHENKQSKKALQITKMILCVMCSFGPEVRLEMFENGGGAGMIFYYSGPDTDDRFVVVPPCAMTPAAPGTDVASGGLLAEFMYQVVAGFTPVVLVS